MSGPARAHLISAVLEPGVSGGGSKASGFNRFSRRGKPLKRLNVRTRPFTRLKPGANERNTAPLLSYRFGIGLSSFTGSGVL